MLPPSYVLSVVFLCCLMIILFLSSVEGAACSVRVVAEAREDFVALRDKTFTAFRKECRGKNGVERTKDCSSCSFSTEPASPPRFDFVLRPIIPPFRLEFTVKANADALVALAESQTKGSIFAEIGIGGWSNSKSSIRACYSQICPALLGGDAVHDETGIISDVESRPFWVEYKGGVVTVGKGGQTEAFMEWDAKAYHMKSPVPVHVGISTFRFRHGSWTFYQFCP